MQLKLRIMNETGHTELMVSVEELVDQINDHPSHWISLDGAIVERKSIETVNWETVETVDLVPAIVGGKY
jgi:hypothetical protein